MTVLQQARFWLAKYVLWLGLIFLVDLLLFYSGNYLELLIKNRLEYDGGDFLLMRCGEIKYQYYENGEIYQKIQELMNRFHEVSWERIRSRAYASQLAGSLLGILYYLLSAGPWIFFLLLAAMLPPLFLSIYAAKREFVSWETFFPFYIKSRYLTELLTKRRNIREARIFQYTNYVENAWEEALAKFNQGQIRSNLKPRYLAGFCVFLQYFVTIAVLFLLFPRIQEQTMTVGVFVAVAQAMWSFTGEFQYGVIQMAKGLEEGKLFDQKIEYFMGLELEGDDYGDALNSGDITRQKNNFQTDGGKKKYPFRSLVLKDIWYRYAPKEPYILKGVSLEIKDAQRMALVGQNGSGKTTLIKILLGLLAPERGEIRLNGVVITDQNRSLLQKATSAVFQDYIKYSLSLPESLNLGRESGPASEEEMTEMLRQLQPEGDFLAALKDGIHTFLGKEIENGQELSGGQWQTVASARAMLSEKPLLMLDEPTAALDPMAEAAVHDLIYEKNRQKAVLLVTHRLGAVVHADCIYVLKDGKISESGNHSTLMHLQKDYAKLFQTQQHWYQEKTDSGKLAEEGTVFQKEVIAGGVCNE